MSRNGAHVHLDAAGCGYSADRWTSRATQLSRKEAGSSFGELGHARSSAIVGRTEPVARPIASELRGCSKLSPLYTAALTWAATLHRAQRMNTKVPYLAHVIGVSSLVLEDGGTETDVVPTSGAGVHEPQTRPAALRRGGIHLQAGHHCPSAGLPGTARRCP